VGGVFLVNQYICRYTCIVGIPNWEYLIFKIIFSTRIDWIEAQITLMLVASVLMPFSIVVTFILYACLRGYTNNNTLTTTTGNNSHQQRGSSNLNHQDQSQRSLPSKSETVKNWGNGDSEKKY
jgi:hypothetical protein